MAFVLLTTAAPVWSAERWALLVAVGRCKDINVSVLAQGPQAKLIDVQEMSKALMKKDFYPARIITLEEEHATLHAILQELDKLAARVQPQDTVVFYFSGHGGRVQGHLSLCPYDARHDSAQNDLTDDQLRTKIEKLKTKNVTIILDCCFNALNSKDPNNLPKFLSRGPYAAARPITVPEDRAVVLQASQDDEEAKQEEVQRDRWEGVFTKYLCQELNHANAETTYRQLMERVQQRVKAHMLEAYASAVCTQNPRIRGDDALIDRRLFDIGAAAAPVQPYSLIREVAMQTAVLDHGQQAGVTKGSQYAIFPPDDTTFLPKDQLGTLTITAVQDGEATATIQERLPGTIKVGCRAVETKHVVHIPEKTKVRVRVEAPKAAQADLQQALSGLDFVDLKAATPDLILKVSQEKDALHGNLYAADGKTPYPPVNGLKADNEGTSAATPQDLVAKFARTLENCGVLRGLVSMRNPNPAFTVEIRTDKPVYQLGEHLVVTFKVNLSQNQDQDQDLFLGLVHIDANGTPNPIFPPRSRNGAENERKDGRIHGGKEYSIPSKEFSGGIKSYDIKPPTGRETIIAVVTRTPVDWEKATRAVVAKELPTLTSKGVGTTMEDVQNSPLSEWATALTSFTIDTPIEVKEHRARH